MGEGLVCVTDPGRQSMNVFTSMFLHGSWMHLLGNMWFLWLFGNNVEDAMTRPRFFVFYLLCGLAAALAAGRRRARSAVPMVGASGAISGVMGAYLVLFPRVRVFSLVPLGFYCTTIALPAWAMLIYWAVLQFFGGLARIGGEGRRRRVLGARRRLRRRRRARQAVREARWLMAHQSHHWQPERQGWR